MDYEIQYNANENNDLHNIGNEDTFENGNII